jgi:hypothetical protein
VRLYLFWGSRNPLQTAILGMLGSSSTSFYLARVSPRGHLGTDPQPPSSPDSGLGNTSALTLCLLLHPYSPPWGLNNLFQLIALCLLKNLKTLGLTPNLKSKKLICLSVQIWPQYQLDNQHHWPEYGTFDPTIL